MCNMCSKELTQEEIEKHGRHNKLFWCDFCFEKYVCGDSE